MSKLTIHILGRRALRDKEVERLVRSAARAVWAHFGYPFDGSVDITMTDDQGIRVINREQREIDAATDVLSFPMNDFYEGGYERESLLFDPETNALPLGDMVISVERAREQGEEYGHGFRRECAYLTVHSMLHLLGFDHLDEGEQKARMRSKEELILAGLGLERE